MTQIDETGNVPFDEATGSPEGVVVPRNARNFAWAGLSRVGAQGVQFAAGLALARLLPPKYFGLAAIVWTVTNFASLFSDLGVGGGLIHADAPDRELVSSGFWLNVAVSFLLAGGVAGFSFVAPTLFGQPRLRELLLLSCSVFALSYTVVPTALLERRLEFKRLAITELSAFVVGSAAGVVWAALRGGPESLLIGPLVTAGLTTIGLWVQVRFRVGRPTRDAVRRLWRFGGGLVAFNFTNYWYRNFDNLVLGRTSSPVSLGYYSRSYTLMTLPVFQVGSIAGRVLFPTLVSVRGQPERYNDLWLRTTRTMMAVSLPLPVIFCAAAHPLIVVLYGNQWLPMVPLLVLLALSAPPQLLMASLGCVYMSLGRTATLFKVTLAQTITATVGIVIGSKWGVTGVATAVVVNTWGTAIIPLVIGLRLIQIRARTIAGILAPVAAAALVSGLLMWSLLLATSLPSLLELVLVLPVGGGVYWAIALGFDRDLRAITLRAMNRLVRARPIRTGVDAMRGST